MVPDFFLPKSGAIFSKIVCEYEIIPNPIQGYHIILTDLTNILIYEKNTFYIIFNVDFFYSA